MLCRWLVLCAATISLGPTAARADEGPPPGQPAALARLTRQLTDDDIRVRWYAVYALGQLGHEAAAADQALIRTLQNLGEDEYVRGGAAWALGRIGAADAPAVSALSGALRSKLNSVRRHAAEALGQLGPPSRAAVAPLLAVLQDNDPAVRIEAAVALWRIERHTCARALLEQSLVSADAAVRFQAAMAVGRLGQNGPPLLPALVWALRDPSPDVGREAAWRWARWGRPR